MLLAVVFVPVSIHNPALKVKYTRVDSNATFLSDELILITCPTATMVTENCMENIPGKSKICLNNKPYTTHQIQSPKNSRHLILHS